MEIIKSYVTNNRHYKANRIMVPGGYTIHSVGTPQPNPDVFVKLWNATSNKYLAQLVVGVEKAYEVLPCFEEKGKAVFCWHVGSANDHMIGIEMTEPSTIKYTGGANWIDLNPEKTKAHVLAVYTNTVDIIAQGCLFHGFDPLKDGVILSHRECRLRGIGTNHGDPEHLWNKFGLTMDQFRRDVKATMDKISAGTQKPLEPVVPAEPSEPAKTIIKKGDIVKIAQDATYYNGSNIPDWVKDQNWIVKKDPVGDRVVVDKNEAGTNAISSAINAKYLTVVRSPFKPYMVKVSIDDLNMRTGPSTSYPRIGYIPSGVFTIVEENGDWGRLKARQEYNGKSVAAWIHLGYTTRVGE